MQLSLEEVKKKDQLPFSLLRLADDSEEMINEYTNRGTTYVARNGYTEVGVIVVMHTRPFTVEVMNVAVKPEFENQGVCKRMLQYVETIAREQGMKTIEIGTGTPGAIQIYIYQRCGYRVSGIDFGYFTRMTGAPIVVDGREYSDMIRLSKHL